MSPLHGRSINASVTFNIYHATSLFLVSASIIFLQIALMRLLSITRYHHFSYLVISTALLGFGASGTFLTFTSDHIKKHFNRYIPLFVLCFMISAPLSYAIAENIPLDIQYIFFSGHQIVLFVLYNLCIFIPFFCGAVIIGAMLIYFELSVPLVYAANMLGSGTGGIMAIGALFLFPAAILPSLVTFFVFVALLAWTASSIKCHRSDNGSCSVIMVVIAIVCSLTALFIRPHIHVDQYKLMSQLDLLEREGKAARIVSASGPRGQIDIYDAPSIHHVLFAGLNADVLPPPELSVLVDGNYAGPVFMIDNEDDARILDFTPQSIPYRLIETPRVLLLGEIGGANIWLARRFGAAEITVVQEDPILNGIMIDELSELSGGIYAKENVHIVNKEPYLFLEQSNERYDIIEIVSAEGMPAGVGGLQSLDEDYMLTVESLTGCLDLLTERGVVAVTRGIQTPPRDNIKIFALFAEALERSGVKDIRGQLLQARNYLAINTMLSKKTLDAGTIGNYVAFTKKLLMDAEYYPGIRSDEIIQLNVVQGPENRNYSFYHYAAMKILSKERKAFYDEWAYEIRPPTNNRPYFYDYFKWSSLGRFIESYGRQWLQRLELGYVVLVLAIIEIVITAFFFILVPLFFAKRDVRQSRGKGAVLVYFLCIGFGFMFIEMIFIQWLIRFLGSPVYSVTVALTAILVFAGLGSLYQQNRERDPVRGVRRALSGIIIVSVLYAAFLYQVLSAVISYPAVVRFIITAILIAPISFFMGWMFPLGMILLKENEVELMPWAWGINGFASVSAAPMAVMLSMSFGFKAVLFIALLLYGIAGSVVQLLGVKGSRDREDQGRSIKT